MFEKIKNSEELIKRNIDEENKLSREALDRAFSPENTYVKLPKYNIFRNLKRITINI